MQSMNDVILRPWRKQDAQPLAALANNRRVWLNLRDTFPHPYTVTDALQWIQMRSNEQPIQHFCIEYNGRTAGSIGVVPKTDVYRCSIEIGYFVGEPYWGKGIATSAVASLIGYIKEQFDVVRVYAEVFEHNKASMQVLRKNGFHLEGIRQRAIVKDGVVMDDYVWALLL